MNHMKSKRTASTRNKAQAIFPLLLGGGRVKYARGMRAGQWVFATGQMAQGYPGGIAASVLSAHLPLAGRPKHEKEARAIFKNVNEVLAEAGATPEDVVRVDQYYRSWKAVDPYHLVRFENFGKCVPPSTSMVMNDLLLPDADMDVQFLAFVQDKQKKVEHVRDKNLDGPPTSGFSMGVTAGGLIFLSGFTPGARPGKPGVNGIAVEATMPEGALWKGQPIHLETEYIITQCIAPALERTGSSLEHVVKAQIYLTHPEEVAGFNTVWSKYFGNSPPATTIVPSPNPSIGVAAARVEINVLAVQKNGAAKKQIVDTDVFPAYENQSVAVKAGDLLLLSGLMAVDEGGLVESARVDPRQPHYGSSIEAQADCIIANAAKIAEAAGTSLDNIVRIQQFHTDISDFYQVHKVWREYLPDHALPFSAIGVPGPMSVPGATLMMDLWFYAP